MALFRKVHTTFWKDPKVIEEMTPEGKLLFLYTLTNPNTTQIGIYKITKKQIAFELGYSQETINTLLDIFENKYKLIKYNIETRELAIKHWGKYNLDRGGKPMIDCIRKELKEVKDKSLIKYIYENIDKEDIKKVFYEYLDVSDYESYNDTWGSIGQEKEKEQEQEKEKDKDKEEDSVGKFLKYYEKNVGLINYTIITWINEISENIDFELFEKAIEIATNKGKLNKAYINGIIIKWMENNINTIDKLKNYENKGVNKNGEYSIKHSKPKYAESLENEDESIYKKPSEEELNRVRELLGK